MKPVTLQSWRSCLDKWLLPNLGDMPLADVANGAMKTLVDKMSTAGLSAKSIVNYCEVVKLVVASAVNAEGEESIRANGTTNLLESQSLIRTNSVGLP